MADRIDVESQVALAAALDTSWLEVALIDPEILSDATLWAPAGDGAMDVLAAHPWVRHMVEEAVVSDRVHVRATVASRPDLDTELYVMLGSDLHPAVRARVAANHAVPTPVIERLAHDAETSVQHTAQSELARRAPRRPAPARDVVGAA
jgi:hypothetical protein